VFNPHRQHHINTDKIRVYCIIACHRKMPLNRCHDAKRLFDEIEEFFTGVTGDPSEDYRVQTLRATHG
jgi:hypothetical protein